LKGAANTEITLRLRAPGRWDDRLLYVPAHPFFVGSVKTIGDNSVLEGVIRRAPTTGIGAALAVVGVIVAVAIGLVTVANGEPGYPLIVFIVGAAVWLRFLRIEVQDAKRDARRIEALLVGLGGH
jgi:hypothetical protein